MNFSITFSDEALQFGANLIENNLVGLAANIDGTDYRIQAVDTFDDGEVYIQVSAYNEATGDYDKPAEKLLLYSCKPNAKEIKTIKLY